MNDVPILLAMYQEQVEMARKHEDHRANATNLTLAAGGAIIALIYRDSPDGNSFIVLPLLLIFFGLFGFLFSLKHYERNRFHVSIARYYRDQLESNSPSTRIASLRESGRKRHDAEYPYLHRLRLNHIWASCNLILVFAGIAILLINR